MEARKTPAMRNNGSVRARRSTCQVKEEPAHLSLGGAESLCGPVGHCLVYITSSAITNIEASTMYKYIHT